MKLVDLLVEELPKRSGWPVGADYVVQDCDGSHDLKFGAGDATVSLDERGVWCNSEKPVNWGVYTEESYIRDVAVQADDAGTSIIFREDYEALTAQTPKWDGVGLPPPSIECEYLSNGSSWGTVKVIGYDEDKVVFKPSGKLYYAAPVDSNSVFRPLKSVAETDRELTIAALQCSLVGSGYCLSQGEARTVVDAIAQGKVFGIKLAD